MEKFPQYDTWARKLLCILEYLVSGLHLNGLVQTNQLESNINNFFHNLYTASGIATQSAQSGLGAVVAAALDPPKTQNFLLNDIPDALSFDLSLYSEGSNLVKALVRYAPQTVGLMQKPFPSGTADGQYQD